MGMPQSWQQLRQQQQPPRLVLQQQQLPRLVLQRQLLWLPDKMQGRLRRRRQARLVPLQRPQRLQAKQEVRQPQQHLLWQVEDRPLVRLLLRVPRQVQQLLQEEMWNRQQIRQQMVQKESTKSRQFQSSQPRNQFNVQKVQYLAVKLVNVYQKGHNNWLHKSSRKVKMMISQFNVQKVLYLLKALGVDNLQ